MPSLPTEVASAQRFIQLLWPFPFVLRKTCALFRSNKSRIIKITHFTYKYCNKLPLDIFKLKADCRDYLLYLNKIPFLVSVCSRSMKHSSFLPAAEVCSPLALQTPCLAPGSESRHPILSLSSGFRERHFLLSHLLPFRLRSWHGRNAKGRFCFLCVIKLRSRRINTAAHFLKHI